MRIPSMADRENKKKERESIVLNKFIASWKYCKMNFCI